jgi:hypothetical protein
MMAAITPTGLATSKTFRSASSRRSDRLHGLMAL